MKKMTAMLVAILLCFGFSFALAAEKTVDGLYTVTYDDTRFTCTDSTEAPDPEASVQWLFKLTDEKVTLEAVTEPLEAFAELTLLTASEDDQQAYIDYFLDAYAIDNAKYEGMILTTQDGIPFTLFTMEDQEGHYYYATTVVKGQTIGFYGYYEGAGEAFEPDDRLYDLFATFLEGYVPAK